MKPNPIKKLLEINESIWLDNLSRKLIRSGELQRLIDEDGVSGVTSNPTIFQKAISGSKDYDESLRGFLEEGVRHEKELFLGLATEDVSRAAQLFWPVYLRSGGLDGFISIEVSPDLANDTEKTVSEAKRLFSAIGRKNILVKVPGTREGLPAIEELTAEGVNVNVTLLFSVSRYEDVAEAYLRGLERRIRRGKPIDEVVSVASFFVSRVDTLVDKLLEARLLSAASEEERQKIKSLMGRAAAANAKLAYKKYREIFRGQRFQGPPQGPHPENPVGKHGDQESRIQRREIRGRIDRPRFDQYPAGCHAESLPRPRPDQGHDRQGGKRGGRALPPVERGGH